MLFVCHFMSFDSAYVIHATRTLSDISQLTTNYILASRNVYCAVFIHGLSLVFYGTKERNRGKKKMSFLDYIEHSSIIVISIYTSIMKNRIK